MSVAFDRRWKHKRKYFQRRRRHLRRQAHTWLASCGVCANITNTIRRIKAGELAK